MLHLSGVPGDPLGFGALYADDYDLDAATYAYVDALDEAAGKGVYVTRSGIVYADLDHADRARAIDWTEWPARCAP